MVKRAWLYITRKRIKTLVLLLVLFVMGTSLISALAIQKAAAVSEEQMLERIGSGFTISNNLQYNLGTSRGEGTVPAQAIDAICEVEGVTKCLKRMNGIADMENAKLVPLSGATGWSESQEYERVLAFTGENDSSLDKNFTGGVLKLEQGRHLREGDRNKMLVHETFAKQNGLNIGDVLTLSPSAYDQENDNQSGQSVDVEIVGLFSGTNPIAPTMREEMCENTVFSDLDTVKQLYAYEEGEEIYQDATFYTSSVSATPEIMNKAKKLDVDWKSYELTQNGSDYVALGESVETLGRMIRLMLGGSIIVGIVVLSFFLVMWVQGRKKEMGILISIGISKGKIAGQLLCETLLIGVVGLGLSYFGGQAIAKSIGAFFLERVSQESVANLNNGLGGMLGADLESAATAQTIDHLDVMIGNEEVVALFAIGLVVIMVAVAVSVIPILRKQPKEILTQMS
ncbi:ABC transporter permease [Bifidobacterium eulemuris]|uniref:ABC transporter permease n=1 Tax=Bifidobacterium eulemuris TaxID=1765219 RepID=A0A261GCA8_9BIFI|nr:ABC transporter permease [Bifidobacterium eulemuris]OZG69052.1 peptide ABC transporter permease [Bifidobacterium eulemuris]QOL31422.1 ABC transporter permease [Bifidobacterium eulemuris]